MPDLREDNDVADHDAVLGEAFKLMLDREESHKALWKKYGVKDNMLHVRSKKERMEVRLEDGDVEGFCQEALDLINYTVFSIRNARAGRMG